MSKLMIPILAGALVLAGCGQKDDAQKVASLESQVSTLEAEIERQIARNETLQTQNTDYDTRLRDATAERDSLRIQLNRLESSEKDTAGDTDALKARIAELEAEVEALRQAAAATPDPETTPEPEPPVKIDTEAVKRKMEELWPLLQAGDRNALGDMQDLLDGANKELRDTYITQVRDWVKDEPESKQARMVLAVALATRFQDLKDPMQMGALAGEIKDQTEAALKIDPDYYEARHFLAILKANYPSFTPEFKTANEALDKALELQAKMTWEDRFADIYAAYGMWYRMQKQYDDAAAKVQAGLDLAPRNQGLLDEMKRINNAQGGE
jgi:outer membrane murein-binding lipoprotein Lpp